MRRKFIRKIAESASLYSKISSQTKEIGSSSSLKDYYLSDLIFIIYMVTILQSLLESDDHSQPKRKKYIYSYFVTALLLNSFFISIFPSLVSVIMLPAAPFSQMEFYDF